MSLTKLITATVLATAFALVVMPGTVEAQTLTQEQELQLDTNVRVTCTGAYGQNCTVEASASGDGEQRQRIEGVQVVYKDGRRIVYRADGTPLYHQVVNTALDFNAMAGVAGVIITGGVAGILKFKNRVA